MFLEDRADYFEVGQQGVVKVKDIAAFRSPGHRATVTRSTAWALRDRTDKNRGISM